MSYNRIQKQDLALLKNYHSIFGRIPLETGRGLFSKVGLLPKKGLFQANIGIFQEQFNSPI